ncbi:MAG: hypothetical protein DMF85_12705 [Acidobacteria bacterium]|nr:MAG: hypothetical protein DMF85_12705 [Acidobacteriota bacterium]
MRKFTNSPIHQLTNYYVLRATESIPAFLTIVIMPLAVSITDGIAFGFIACAILELAAGRARDVHWLVYLFAVPFVARYGWLAK